MVVIPVMRMGLRRLVYTPLAMVPTLELFPNVLYSWYFAIIWIP